MKTRYYLLLNSNVWNLKIVGILKVLAIHVSHGAFIFQNRYKKIQFIKFTIIGEKTTSSTYSYTFLIINYTNFYLQLCAELHFQSLLVVMHRVVSSAKDHSYK